MLKVVVYSIKLKLEFYILKILTDSLTNTSGSSISPPKNVGRGGSSVTPGTSQGASMGPSK
jgi:hypothetical protein